MIDNLRLVVVIRPAYQTSQPLHPVTMMGWQEKERELRDVKAERKSEL